MSRVRVRRYTFLEALLSTIDVFGWVNPPEIVPEQKHETPSRPSQLIEFKVAKAFSDVNLAIDCAAAEMKSLGPEQADDGQKAISS